MNNNPNDTYGQRTYSTFVSSPKASVYVCPIQFFKKYIFERPNLLKKLREKYYIKKELWEKQLTNCLSQRKELHHRERNHSLKEETQQISVFSELTTEGNRNKILEITSRNSFFNPNDPVIVKKSVKDLREKISQMSHRKVFKNEIQTIQTNEKFIHINDTSLEKSFDLKEKVTPISNSVENQKTAKKNFSLENQMKFISKKYDELIKENKNNRPSEIFNFQSEKDNNLNSRIKVYLKGKFKNHFNKTSNEPDMIIHRHSNSMKRFNESLEKSIKIIKEREKLRLSFLEDSQNITTGTIKSNKHLALINKIDFSNALGKIENTKKNV